MEYGSEFDLYSNRRFKKAGEDSWVPESWQLFRSGRDALGAFAEMAGRKRVMLPALCCESMIRPFAQNGYEVVFYRLCEDLTADAEDVAKKIKTGDLLLYMRYFGIRTFPDELLRDLKAAGKGLLFLEDRTHDILIRRRDGDFRPDATAASLRKWAALPEGGMLETELGTCRCRPDPSYGDLRYAAMEEKSRYLESEEAAMKESSREKLSRAEALLDESCGPAAMCGRYRELLQTLDTDSILRARQKNLERLMSRIQPLVKAGKVRLMTDAPEKSGLYLPVLVGDRDEVQQQMIRRKFYCPAAIWPEPEAAAGVCRVSHYVTEHMLSLLCDQRYDEADMERQIDALTEILQNGRCLQ